MNNFNSIFEELSKLYEEEEKNVASAKQEVKDEKDSDIATSSATQGPSDALQTKGLGNNTLKEEADDVVEDDFVDEEGISDAPAEEPVVEDEPRQVICECDKCGALVIKEEADIVIDEESDLVNIEDECQFCEEAKGYKIIGVVAPYEVTTYEEEVDEAPVEEALKETYYACAEIDGEERRFPFEDREEARKYIAAIKSGEAKEFAGKKIGSVWTE